MNERGADGDAQKRMFAVAQGLPADAYERKLVDTTAPGDYGADPLGGGMFRMVPSGDIVTFEEMKKRRGLA